jgi:hypothetical protein
MASGDVLANAVIAVRVGTLKLVADSAAVTAEASVGSVTCYLETGKTYALTGNARISSTVASENSIARVREDTASGTQVTQAQVTVSNTSTQGFNAAIYGEYTAVATGNKTFHLTLQRNGGTGNHQIRGAAVAPSWLYVELIPT